MSLDMRFSGITTALMMALLALPARADGFVSAIDDLPLMPGLSEIDGRTMAFDSAQGRIVEAFAAGPLAPGAVRAFYVETLPQLGWRRVRPDTFTREGEILRLEFLPPAGVSSAGGGIVVHFSLAPDER